MRKLAEVIGECLDGYTECGRPVPVIVQQKLRNDEDQGAGVPREGKRIGPTGSLGSCKLWVGWKARACLPEELKLFPSSSPLCYSHFLLCNLYHTLTINSSNNPEDTAESKSFSFERHL